MKSKIARTTIFVLMSLFAIIMLYPFYFMLKTAFKSNTQFISGANSFSLDSWQKLFTSLPVGRQLFNSLIVCTSSITLILIFSTYAGFGLAFLNGWISFKINPIELLNKKSTWLLDLFVITSSSWIILRIVQQYYLILNNQYHTIIEINEDLKNRGAAHRNII